MAASVTLRWGVLAVGQGQLWAVHALRQAHLSEEPAALPHGRLEPFLQIFCIAANGRFLAV
ncbi:hypothetical protein R2601_26801 [Salipiger bermudensis HTCC2601]|uniref:Uncharacterized protein n=1 Tax=Salipiger bermudensis (strain DSM 26914 / JCM 13377 / KCTC 12554 / HTCC2601) TaxID=314265 RepID=Q0FPA7_SALBH|nr:hypothetical protein R2601_26801 [Salipiger bermudensis HTCC2601]